MGPGLPFNHGAMLTGMFDTVLPTAGSTLRKG